MKYFTKIAAPKTPPSKPKGPAKPPAKPKAPTKSDIKAGTVESLYKAYPSTYKTKGDASLARVDATDTTALYKALIKATSGHSAAIGGKPLSSVNKRNVIAAHNIINSPEYQNIPKDVLRQILEEGYGGDEADLTLGGYGQQDVLNQIQDQLNALSQSQAAQGGNTSSSLYGGQYTPATGSHDPRFDQAAAEEIAKIKSEREQMKDHEKEKAYRYINPSSGEKAQVYDNPADQKVYQDQVDTLRSAMRNLGPIVSQNSGVSPEDFDGFSVYNTPAKTASWDGQLKEKVRKATQALIGNAIVKKTKDKFNEVKNKFTTPPETGEGIPTPKIPNPLGN